MELVSSLVSSSVAQTTSCRMVGLDVCVCVGGGRSCPNLRYNVAFFRTAGRERTWYCRSCQRLPACYWYLSSTVQLWSVGVCIMIYMYRHFWAISRETPNTTIFYCIWFLPDDGWEGPKHVAAAHVSWLLPVHFVGLLLVPGLSNARYVANIETKNSALVSFVASLRIRLRRCDFSLLAQNEGKWLHEKTLLKQRTSQHLVRWQRSCSHGTSLCISFKVTTIIYVWTYWTN